jgi:hypothetical protein
MPKSPEEMMETMIKNIREKTGYNINHWIEIAEASGETKHMAIIKYLKANHGISQGYANLIAFKLREKDNPIKTNEQILDDQYSKKKELQPIYDYLSEYIQKIDEDISKRICKGYVDFVQINNL